MSFSNRLDEIREIMNEREDDDIISSPTSFVPSNILRGSGGGSKGSGRNLPKTLSIDNDDRPARRTASFSSADLENDDFEKEPGRLNSSQGSNSSQKRKRRLKDQTSPPPSKKKATGEARPGDDNNGEPGEPSAGVDNDMVQNEDDLLCQTSINEIKNAVKLKELKKNQLRASQTIKQDAQFPTPIRLIGKTKENQFIACRGREILVVNDYKASEADAYLNLYEKETLPCTITLSRSLLLSAFNTSEKAYQVILKAGITPEIDRILLANGFQLQPQYDGIHLVAVTECLEPYGLPDLTELLELMHDANNNQITESTPMLRCSKVVHYLKEKVRDLIAKQEYIASLGAVQKTINKLTDNDITACPHGLPFVSRIFLIPSAK